jgi:HprK-related kinase A
LNVSTLTQTEIAYRLSREGLYLQTGPFIIHLKTDISAVATSIGLLYADYPLLQHCDFADFHVRLAKPANWRRWIKPQVEFLFDEVSPFKPLPLDQAYPMLEWGLNWCVSNHVNHCLLLHAAVVEKNGCAAILPAPPGSGKSTLCAALVNRGWRLLSDELTLVRISDGKIIPLPRPISLKNKSISVIRDFAPDAVFSHEVCDTVKGTIAHMRVPADSVSRALDAAPPCWVIFPQYQSNSSTNLESLAQSRAFMRVADNAFNYSLLGTQGFKVLTGLIDSCLCYELTYSNLDEAIATFDHIKPPPNKLSNLT